MGDPRNQETSPAPATRESRPWRVAAALALVLGVVLVIIGCGALGSGAVAATLTARQQDKGAVRTAETALTTAGYALLGPSAVRSDTMGMGTGPRNGDRDGLDDDPDNTGDEIGLGTLPAEVLTLEVRASSTAGKEIFLGVGPRSAVETYLEDVAYSEVSEVGYSPESVQYRNVAGTRAPLAPEDQSFWVASDAGSGAVELHGPAMAGEWVVVVMNRDASPNITIEAQVGARSELLLPATVALFLAGGVLVIVGGALVVLGALGLVRPRASDPSARQVAGSPSPVDSEGSAAEGYPARLTGELAPHLSRGLWLVKWVLALPHIVILFFLWWALAITTIVGWFAILFTGRYPRPLFDFAVGVLRWSWRVAFYGYSALGTDEYPPFTLSRTSYPADVDVTYPERLSRGLVLVKSWLLAIPHLVIVGLFAGGTSWAAGDDAWFSRVDAPSLVGVLVLIAAVILLVTGRYPRPTFDLVMGLNRWSFRVLAYVLLLRDEYPPFRLDQGARDGTNGPVPVVDTGAR